ncbi:hypothetical protein CH063_05381 [Colletotrichum higginsianum]|uniref:Oxidoreductase n=1 Tax=Colletotrichum higginsianum (strain IMI 349063) TaxID=759273 RepID=H1UYS8_COLHI|nr:Oxidoreductase [Colletotrichum higginsianum IMI 349063]OBR14919.1 Oxidoreductase [Colletotrichum higginsianum IMI 349063]CCF33129.1 hypothetical protein CH063_05381 [Colletotrichum higginsianum]
MSAPIKTVALAGANGFLGKVLLQVLLQSGRFQLTVLTRKGSRHEFPAGVAVKKVDYESVPSLEDALRGQDALVSALAFDAIHIQKNVVDAAFNAGVRRMIPSEYGNDTKNPKLASIPIYQPKIAIRKYLDEKVAERPSFSYTIIMNVSFLAPGYALDFLVDVRGKKAHIKDGGDVKFNATTMPHIGQAVIGILTHLDETANRPVKISSVETTQNEIVEIAKAVDPSGEWEMTHSRTEDLERIAHERWNAGDHSEEVVEMFINRAFIGTEAGYFPETDNKLLGIESIGREGLEKIIRTAIKG